MFKIFWHEEPWVWKREVPSCLRQDPEKPRESSGNQQESTRKPREKKNLTVAKFVIPVWKKNKTKTVEDVLGTGNSRE